MGLTSEYNINMDTSHTNTQDVRTQFYSKWFMTGSSDRFKWTPQLNFAFHKKAGSFLTAKRLSVSQGLCSTQTHLRLVPKLRINGDVPTLLLYAFFTCDRTNFTFIPLRWFSDIFVTKEHKVRDRGNSG